MELLPALEDFYDRFHHDILAYHGTTLIEMLNDVRWGIHEYLKPEFQRSYTPPLDPEADVRYSFEYPAEVQQSFARTCYCAIMNSVRTKPYVKRFTGTTLLKGNY